MSRFDSRTRRDTDMRNALPDVDQRQVEVVLDLLSDAVSDLPDEHAEVKLRRAVSASRNFNGTLGRVAQHAIVDALEKVEAAMSMPSGRDLGSAMMRAASAVIVAQQAVHRYGEY